MHSSVGLSLRGSHNLNHRIQLSHCASLPTAGSAHYSLQEASSLIPAWWIKGNITFCPDTQPLRAGGRFVAA